MNARTSYLIRIGAEGAERVTGEVMKIEQALNRTGQAAEAAGTKAERAAARQQAAYLRTAEAAARADPARRQQVIDLVTGVNANAGRAERSAAVFEAQMQRDERAARALRAALDPLAAAQDRYNAELIELNGLYTRGAITQQQFLQGQTMLRQQLDASTAALGRNTNGLTRNQVASRLNLTRQGADVLVTGGMGMNPAMIALQQGPQILDALATSGIRASAGMIALGAAVGTAAAAVGVLAAGWVTGERDALALERAVNGLGRTSGLTRGELERLTDAAAENGRVSVASAREQAVAYLNTGRIGRDNIQGLIEIGRDYASVMGMDAEQATQSLAQAMLNPSKSARELSVTMGVLNVEQIKQIDALVKSGQLFAAQAVLLNGLKSSISGHAEDVAEITSAWTAARIAVGNFFTEVSERIYESDRERLDRLNLRINEWTDTAIRNGGLSPQYQRQLAGWIREADELSTKLRDRDDRRRETAAEAARNQREVDAWLRSLANGGGSRAGSAEAEARREEIRRRREEDSRAALDLEIARLTSNQDVVRQLELEGRERGRIRDLVDAGASAEAARTQAAAEMARLAEAQGIATSERGRELGRQAEIEVTRLLNERTVMRVIEDRAALERLILDYQQRGFDLAEATAQAESDRARIVEARAVAMEREVEAARRARELELLRLEGRSDKDPTVRAKTREDAIQRRAREIEEREGLDFGRAVERATQEIDQELTATARGALRGGLREFIEDIRSGGVEDAFANALERAFDREIDAATDKLIDMLLNIGTAGAGKGAGGWVQAGLNFLFGRNAVGTESWRGGLTWVGENGPELINAPRGARIIPAHRARSEMGAATIVVNINNSYDGALVVEEVLRDRDKVIADQINALRRQVPAIAVGAVSQARQRRLGG